MSLNKVVLAYSGGLDTSVICRRLQETHCAEVVTFTADIGQGDEVEPARSKSQAMGVTEIFIVDLNAASAGESSLGCFDRACTTPPVTLRQNQCPSNSRRVSVASSTSVSTTTP